MIRATLSVIILLISSILFAQPDTDSDKKAEIIKQGWNFCPLPVLGFNSDLGFQYGAICKEIKGINANADVGEYLGFKLNVTFDSFNNKFVMNVKGAMSHPMEVGSDPLGNITRIRSSSALAHPEITRNNNGRLVSPTARRIAAP